MNKYLNNINASYCCGCSACVHQCPKQCLRMSQDKDGFFFPIVNNREACIDCSLCAKVCPMENMVESDYPHTFYGAYNTNKTDIVNSSSGGIYPSLAKWIISQGGIVFGASLDDEHKLYHIGVSTESDIQKTIGSKYFQSEIRDTYVECKKELDKGRLVLYTGTPCQVHGLKRYLGKDYDNLYTADVICHGVPSSKMFDAYIDFLEKKHNGKLVDINFRDKKRNGWSITLRYTIEYSNDKRKDYYLINKLSEYFMAFLGGYIERESCYSCPFSSMRRPGDITMGDFWGYQFKRPDLKHDEGLSLIIVNSEHGKRIVDVLHRNGVQFNAVDEECVKASENKNLYKPTLRPEVRSVVYDELQNFGFEYIAKKYFRRTQTLRNKAKNYMPVALVNIIKKLK